MKLGWGFDNVPRWLFPAGTAKDLLLHPSIFHTTIDNRLNITYIIFVLFWGYQFPVWAGDQTWKATSQWVLFSPVILATLVAMNHCWIRVLGGKGSYLTTFRVWVYSEVTLALGLVLILITTAIYKATPTVTTNFIRTHSFDILAIGLIWAITGLCIGLSVTQGISKLKCLFSILGVILFIVFIISMEKNPPYIGLAIVIPYVVSLWPTKRRYQQQPPKVNR